MNRRADARLHVWVLLAHVRPPFENAWIIAIHGRELAFKRGISYQHKLAYSLPNERARAVETIPGLNLLLKEQLCSRVLAVTSRQDGGDCCCHRSIQSHLVSHIMDVVEEDSDDKFSEIFEVPTVALDGISLGGNPLEDSTHSESSSEISGREPDFARQLRKQRKQVLIDGGARRPPRKAKDFSQVLRQHRDELVENWGDHHSQQTPGDAVTTSKMTESNNNQEEDDGLFGDWNQDQTTENAVEQALDNNLANENGDVLVSASSNETPISALSRDDDDLSDPSGAASQGALSFEGLEQTLSMDTEEDLQTDSGVPPGTPSRVLDDLLAVSPDASDDEEEEKMVSQPYSSVMTPELTYDSKTPVEETENGDGDDSATPKEASSTNGNELKEAEDAAETTTIEPKASGQGVSSTAPSSNDDGDFGETAERNLVPSEAPMIETQSLEEGDESPGGFATTPDTGIESQNGSDNFGHFGEAPSSKTVTETGSSSPQASNDELGDAGANNEDEFEDFDAVLADSAPINLSNDEREEGLDATPEPISSSSQDHDDLEEFDTAPSQTPDVPPSGDERSSQAEVPAPANNDDDFGDLDAAPQTGATSTDDTDTSHLKRPSKYFGDVDAAPTKAQDPAPTEDDESGDFGAAPSLAATETKGAATAPENEDDGLSDFNTAPSQPSAPALEDDGSEDFGDFGATSTEGASTSKPGESDGQGDVDASPSQPYASLSAEDGDFGDDFGDFDGAPSQPDASPSTKDGDLGDFNETPSQLKSEQKASVPEDRAHDDLGDFDAAPSPAQVPTSSDDDDFGGFDAAPSESQVPTSSEDADFGHFDAGPVQPTVETRATSSDVGNDKDDFGDLDAAPSEPHGAPSGDDEDFRGFDVAPSECQVPTSSEDDDFGDFDAGPVQPTVETRATSSNVGDDKEDFGDFDAAPSHQVPPSDDEDFGDFDAAPSEPHGAPSGDDDDFGDFDAAPAQPTAETRATSSDVGDDKEDFGDLDTAPSHQVPPSDDEDFGDFDAAPSEPHGAPSGDDDDFGDFDAAPAQPTAETRATSSDVGDDKDDFGDFDAAPSHQVPPSDDEDFGDFDAAPSEPHGAPSGDDDDFGDFDAAPDQSVSGSDSAVSMSRGSELEGARNLLSRLQAKFPFAEIDSTGEQSSKASLGDFIVSPILWKRNPMGGDLAIY